MEEGKLRENMDRKREQAAGWVDQAFLLLLCPALGSGVEQFRWDLALILLPYSVRDLCKSNAQLGVRHSKILHSGEIIQRLNPIVVHISLDVLSAVY